MKLDKRLLKYTLTVCVVSVSFVLAWRGYDKYFMSLGTKLAPHDLLVCVLDLFRARYYFSPGPKPLELEFARFLSPAITLYAMFLATITVFRRKISRLFATGHVVVCGLSEETLILVRKFIKEGRKVLVVEESENSPLAPACSELAVPVIHGSPTDAEILRLARLHKASRIITVLEEDAQNLETALAAYSLAARKSKIGKTLYCYVHLVNTRWCTSFLGFSELARSLPHFEPVVFSRFENIARLTFHRHPLDREPIRSSDPRRVHLILIGFGRLGQALSRQAAHIAHFANNQKLMMTVIDSPLASKRDEFRSRFPYFSEVVDVSYVEGNTGNLETRDLLTKAALDSRYLVTVAICKTTATECFSDAHGLPPEFREQNIPVLLRLNEQNPGTGLSRFAHELESGFIPFAFLEDGMDLDFKADELARAFHENYIERARSEGQILENNPAMNDWQRLDYQFKESNRLLADHIEVKIRAVGCRTVSLSETPDARGFSFTDEEIEIMARMEHARWAAERYLAGWRLGPTDKTRKISPYLVPYDALEENIKEYDRAPMRQIPSLLADQMGMGLVRESELLCKHAESPLPGFSGTPPS